jgi:hypothetical protein
MGSSLAVRPASSHRALCGSRDPWIFKGTNFNYACSLPATHKALRGDTTATKNYSGASDSLKWCLAINKTSPHYSELVADLRRTTYEREADALHIFVHWLLKLKAGLQLQLLIIYETSS